MRHIINIIDSSAIAERKKLVLALKDVLPQYEMLEIGDSQTHEGEAQLWRQVWILALQADSSIILSSGTSENLQMTLDRLWRAPGTNIVTITLELPNQSVAETVAWIFGQLPVDFH